jgi:hypothetical protein
MAPTMKNLPEGKRFVRLSSQLLGNRRAAKEKEKKNKAKNEKGNAAAG